MEDEINEIKSLIDEAVKAGFYNIDVNASTLVDLSPSGVESQQKLNVEVSASLIKYIRSIEPEHVMISIRGEIGEVGGRNSTPKELRTFMKGLRHQLNGLEGISKISIQTRTSHGGTILPNESIAEINFDFSILKLMSQIARKEFAFGGLVQHGASMLPKSIFHFFPGTGCVEIHFATQFQNIYYDYIPQDLQNEIYDWVHRNMSDQKRPYQT